MRPPLAARETSLGHARTVNRIAIVGPVASGKTTLAARLGSSLDLPVFDLDDYYWRHVPPPTDEEWVATHRELVGGERWIISGDYRAVAEPRFRAADAVVWLDLPRSTCLIRATFRKLKGNPTPLVDSWRWIWRYATRGRRDTATTLSSCHRTCSIYRLQSSRAVATFLRQVQSSSRCEDL
jgi:adenylate kinase family enzyme